MVKDAQMKLYLRKRKAGKTQQAAAAAADMTAKTARKWEGRPLPSMIEREPRSWRTRLDPLCAVWDELVLPLLEQDERGELQATTILDELKAQNSAVGDQHLRTLQRRLRDWRAMQGPDREVFFEQDHPPGRESQIDFTHAEELGVTLCGQPFAHLIFELVLSYSGWRFVQVCFGETTEALFKGTQDGFWDLGGLTAVLWSDNLSAATHQLRGTDQRKPTKRFKAFLDHLALDYTRIQAGKSNENGVVEKGHDILKTAIRQALIVRGSRDFSSAEAYCAFVEEVRQSLNARASVARRFSEERSTLRPLPAMRIPTYTDVTVTVRRWSTIRVAENTYSVPSRLIGFQVTARVHPDVIEVLYRGQVTERFPRLRGRGQHRVDYRHVIHSLVTKPGAFARYRYREELYPTLNFRRAYDALVSYRGERADVDYVRILHLAATTMQSEVETALELLLDAGKRFEYGDVKSLVDIDPRSNQVQLDVLHPDLRDFDELLTGGCHVRQVQQTTFPIAS